MFFSFKAFSPPCFFRSNVLSKVNKNLSRRPLSFSPPRMPRSSGRSRSTASPAAARPSLSFTCWGNCTWQTRATAGAFRPSSEQTQTSAPVCFENIPLLFPSRRAPLLPALACFLKYKAARLFYVSAGPSSSETTRSSPCRRSSRRNQNDSDFSSW